MEIRTIVFHHRRGLSDHDIYEEEREFDVNTTDEEINEEYIEWVLEQIGDNFTWYEKEN